jgi:hypothetical protein
MTSIPNELIITIKTSIPGYEKITYKPYMTIPNIRSSDSIIRFDPLIKITESSVKSINDNLRKYVFLNKELFKDLLKKNESSKASNLTQATRSGYVDNNIKIILANLFSTNSVINIGGSPYAIADDQWTTGDWKIDVKQKPKDIDLYKIRDPALYRALVNEEIISGEEQLKSLPKTVVYGNNFSGKIISNILSAFGKTSSSLLNTLSTSTTTTSNPSITNLTPPTSTNINPPANSSSPSSLAISNLPPSTRAIVNPPTKPPKPQVIQPEPFTNSVSSTQSVQKILTNQEMFNLINSL